MSSVDIPKLKSKTIQNFLKYVVSGSQDEAEDLLKKHPELALASRDVTDHAGRIFENITGFQCAIWALDWHMWRMIRKYLPRDEAQKQAESFKTGSWIQDHGKHASWEKWIDLSHKWSFLARLV
jgi:hypothetical protein